MTRGQESLMMIGEELDSSHAEKRSDKPRPRPVLVSVPELEMTEHIAVLKSINSESKGACLWLAGDGKSD
jgi:hypothetical protein